ncbi:ABC transporter ATP-binding protein [Sulfolobus sp. A20]|uniref:ABC transporter ATP-binding protein n=1 Tax=Sulfolobaceae TaxID=118883 RepID=UPI000845CE48|nr:MULTISPECIES: ABC transporter ATP-binding protein [unclassified Sulfolobus]TRM77159.1 ABC transporter ATP-binding protein [Sulfolobus sp. A20-N-F8]TRM79222.1 ABC transporter ATP-binding protein [Sulfolobus sp. B5]TRM80265.1 ABC transporter ATP-binding protein [Sulfolobus sp. D5]TRM88920.1 ABC transporter ATP-binding protein [Sulfolobus sp. C3]TRM98920.1 ABC transporter ATP-binding protein [Sulfolobus sp. F1]TRN02128.1 ABC transporter ATP-binding protein [Sulfolobus sp. E1]
MIKLENVTKIYMGNVKTVALRDINLTISEGEFLAILGPSGSGKSTLLSIIGTLDRPTTGKVYIYDKDITTLDDNEVSKIRNEYIGFVFQNFNLISRLTILENVELPLIARGVSKSKREEIAMEALKLVGLDGYYKKRPNELSGGQQQRVAIARALAQNPKVLLADEPTGNLDSVNAKNIMEIFKKVNDEFNTTVIVVTHDREVASYTERKIYIRDGRIIGEEN